MTSQASQTLALLHGLQYSDGQPILLFSQDPTGLGGQVSRRIVGLRLALILERKVVFPHVTEPPYGQVFEPLHSDVDYREALTHAVDYYSENSSAARIVKLDFWDMWRDLQLKERVYSYITPECRASVNPGLYLDGLLLSFCRLTIEHDRIVADAAARLKVDCDTLGVHIRRGDKSVETPYVPIEAINESIGKLSESGRFSRVFVSSDDVKVFNDLTIPDGLDLIFDNAEQRYNNANHRFLMRNSELSRQETQTAVKNIFLLGRCGSVIGQSNAHFATLSAAQICFRNGGRQYGLLIDGNYALKYSRPVRIIHAIRRVVRSIIRQLFPWMTLQYMKRRYSR